MASNMNFWEFLILVLLFSPIWGPFAVMIILSLAEEEDEEE